MSSLLQTLFDLWHNTAAPPEHQIEPSTASTSGVAAATPALTATAAPPTPPSAPGSPSAPGGDSGSGQAGAGQGGGWPACRSARRASRTAIGRPRRSPPRRGRRCAPLITIAVEPGVICSAAVLDDLVTDQGALAPLAADWGKKPPQDLLKKVGPLRRVPGPLAVLLNPPPTAPASALPDIRVLILSERVGSDDKVGQYMDLPPELNTVTALASDPTAGYRAAVGASAATSVSEALAFSDSAVHRLDGHKLTFLDGDDARTAFLATVPPPHAADWKRLLAQHRDSAMLVPDGTIPFVGPRGFVGSIPRQVVISLLATGTFAISQGCYD
ncbi:MAG: hypothetical protein HOV87_33530 [Catenulispora sp.]|nr:hypothetical protein [Catenulispora sp.]